MCRGRGSNPHAPCGTRDFKLLDGIDALGKNTNVLGKTLNWDSPSIPRFNTES
jgi:hypothetical protein